jgi:hypothetical protein
MAPLLIMEGPHDGGLEAEPPASVSELKCLYVATLCCLIKLKAVIKKACIFFFIIW